MHNAFEEIADNIFGLFAFITIMLLMASVISSIRGDYCSVAGYISTKASSSSSLPYERDYLYISAEEALYDSIYSPPGVGITVNGTLISSEWAEGARMHDENSLAFLKSTFNSSLWRETAVVGDDGQLKTLEFWKGGTE